jgi:uncharacterized membrane protein YhhN
MTAVASAPDVRSPAAGLPLRFRLALALAGLFGLAYLLLAPLLDGLGDVLLKGSGVSLLAIAALQVRSHGNRLAEGAGWLAAVLALGALGDVLLAIPGRFIVGMASFGAGHIVAILFFCRHLRPLKALDGLLVAPLLGFGLIMPLLLKPPQVPLGLAMVYGILLTGMASSLWLSRFPRLAALGALSFVVSDTLIVGRMGGPMISPAIDNALVWSSYFAGQWLITLGVARGLLAKAQHGG